MGTGPADLGRLVSAFHDDNPVQLGSNDRITPRPGFRETRDYHHFYEHRQALARLSVRNTGATGPHQDGAEVLVDKFLIIYNPWSPDMATIHREQQQR